jgi:hypothetical protein
MTTLQPQVFNQSFKNPDDIPDYISIYERPKAIKGRPITLKLSDEEKKNRKREVALKHYHDNRESKQIY